MTSMMAAVPQCSAHQPSTMVSINWQTAYVFATHSTSTPSASDGLNVVKMPIKVASQLPVTPHCNFLWKLPFKIQRPRTLGSAVGIGCFCLPGRSPEPSWADHLSPGGEEFKSNRQDGSIYGCHGSIYCGAVSMITQRPGSCILPHGPDCRGS